VTGRFKKLLNSNEKLLIDGCHSIASAKNLYDYLKTLKGPIYGIWGMQKNKLPDQFIKSFNKIFKKLITITIPNEPNALKADELKKIGKKYILTSAANNIQTALSQISSKKDKTIVIFGSLYLIGEVLSNN
jgi:folylpolyglutamate synthase/dihydropteroate synthase